jgi:Protein of unknown function (DUF1631)
MSKSPIGNLANRRRYGPLVEQCRDKLVGYCDARLAELFKNAGTALLEFAERAESNAVQSRFFDAMGQINRRRGDIEHTFRLELNQGFDGLARGGHGLEDPVDPKSPEGVELALLDPDEMEEAVAAENLILRANADCFPELYALSLRLGAITGGQKLKDAEIPGGPSHLVRSYRRSLEGLNMEVRVKVILYALFDKFVLKPIKPTYDAYNALLADAGILPSLKPVQVGTGRGQPGAPDSRGAKGSKEAAKAAPAATPLGPHSGASGIGGDSGEAPSLGAELFDAILELMSNRRPGQGRAQRRSGPPPTAEEAALQSRELLSAISSLQTQRTPQAVSTAVAEAIQFPNIEVDTAFIERVKDALSQEREQILSAVDRDKMSPMDADLIDLIGMLFEYMLNDPVLPNVAKALLSHLHTPYLKVALIDRRLLVDSRHPARQLLDQMVEAGSLWVEEGNPSRGMFPVMQQVVDRVLQEFTDNVALFDELLAHFEEKMREQQRRSDTTEQRTQEAARGREKLTLAKQRGVREIQNALGRHPVPQAVSAFLSQTWLDQLTFVLLRDPEQDQGSAWRKACAVMDQLIALFDPQASPQARNARLATLPKLRDDIATTAQRLGRFSNANVSSLLALLDSPEDWKAQAKEPAATTLREGLGAGAGTPEPQITSAVTSDEDLPDAERQMVERLRRMRFGTWFEFAGAPGAPTRRIKLSWMSPLTSTCMFVDRAGMQAEIKSLRELAQEILAGRAKVIPKPKHPFIDRALVSIRKMLQGGERSGGPAAGVSSA